MRKRWKRSFVTALSMALAVGNCVPAMAAPAGWKESAAGWQYVNANGSIQKGWFQDTKGDWYFLDYNTGIMKTGWIKPADGKWYFMDYHTGAMKTGWIKPMDGKWYYLNPNSNGTKGAMQTGWVQTPDKKWYYMDASGAMQTGTITVNNQVWTLDANGVWDGKAATSVTYVSTSSGRRPSGGSSSGTTKPDKGYTFKNNELVITKEGKYDFASLTGEVKTLTVEESVKDGTVEIENVTVTGDTIIKGGGSETVRFGKKCALNTVKIIKTVTDVPVHVAFDEGTTIKGNIDVNGKNVNLEMNIDFAQTIIANVAMILKGTGTVSKFQVAGTINVLLQVKKVKTIEVASGEPTITVNTQEKVENLVDNTGKAEINGSADVAGYYDVTLNLGEGYGYWEIVTIDKDGNEKDDTVNTKTVKAKAEDKLKNVINTTGDIVPNKTGSKIVGWYTTASFDAGTEVDVENTTVGTDGATLYAKWSEAAEEAVELSLTDVTATVSGASVKAATASGTAVKVELTATSGSAVTLKTLEFKADGEIAKTDFTEKDVTDGMTFKVVCTPSDTNKYKETTVTVEIVITEN